MSSTICFADTGLYVDTVEWCPHQGHQNLFVCGTYQLLEQPPNQDYVESSEHVDDTPAKPVRVGNIQLYSFNESNETHRFEYVVLHYLVLANLCLYLGGGGHSDSMQLSH